MFTSLPIGSRTKDRLDLAHLDRQIRHLVPRAAFARESDLWPRRTFGRKSADPAMVHYQLEPEQILLESLRRLHILGVDGRNHEASGHGLFGLGSSFDVSFAPHVIR